MRATTSAAVEALMVVGLTVLAQARVDATDVESWLVPSLPDVVSVQRRNESRASFGGHVTRKLRADCDFDCQVEMDARPIDVELEMSFETLELESGRRVMTVVNATDLPVDVVRSERAWSAAGVEPQQQQRRRTKRAVFGYDTRFSLSSAKFADKFPFSTSVRISTGCAGVLLSSRHVLTAAHCIHSGKRYLQGTKKLRVGRLILRKSKKQKKQKSELPSVASVFRTRRSATTTARNKPATKVKWMRARETYLPRAWTSGDRRLMLRHDYAVLKLKKPIAGNSDRMRIGISPPLTPSSGRRRRIHFTAFDEWPAAKKGAAPRLMYRTCGVQVQSADVMYHHCDASRAATGAGVYVRMFDGAARRWERRVVGVYQGHQWIASEPRPKEYNTAVRITPLKYAQICFWTTGDYSQCRGG